MNQREDNNEAIQIKERYMKKLAKGSTRLHPSERVRQRPGQLLAWHNEGTERVNPKTGWRWYPAAASSSVQITPHRKHTRAPFSRCARLRERQFEKILLKYGWEKVSNWECFFVHREKIVSSVYVDDIKFVGKKQNIDPMWKVFNTRSRFGRTNIFP